MTIDITKTTPKLSDLLIASIDSKLRELNIALPGEIIEYDVEKNLASIQPLIKRKYKNDDTAYDLPIINNVPVIFPRTKNSHMVFPVSIGDTGQIFFNQRSIDTWLIMGGRVDPEDQRIFDLNDAVFFPGLFPTNISIGSPMGSLEIKHNQAKIEITKEGKYSIGNSNVELMGELVNIMTQLVDTLTELSTKHMTNTMLGPQPPINLSAYATIKTCLLYTSPSPRD